MSEEPDIQPDKLSPEFDKRIVVLTTTGPCAGLYQIHGTVAQATDGGHPLLDYLEGVRLPDGRGAAVGLIKFKPRYVVYKEISGPVVHRFDTFNPAQL